MSPDRRQLTLTGTDTDRTSLELNRWIDNAYQVPNANSPRYLQVLEKIVRAKHVEGVIPQPDPEVRKFSQAAPNFPARTFLPETDTVNKCLDKYRAVLAWHNSGLRKEPILLSTNTPKMESKLQNIRYPLWVRAREGAGGLMSSMAEDSKTVMNWVGFHWDRGIKSDFLLEEYLPGRDYCFMSIWKEGQLITSMLRERLSWVGHRTIGTGGTSKLNRVVHSDQANKTAVDSIHALAARPNGVFCVDLKADKRDDPFPTEINCRFTTNVHYLTLAAIKYGRPEWNFAWLSARLMLDETIPKCKEYDALPDNLWFTKNVDMGYTIVEDDHWRAAEYT